MSPGLLNRTQVLLTLQSFRELRTSFDGYYLTMSQWVTATEEDELRILKYSGTSLIPWLFWPKVNPHEQFRQLLEGIIDNFISIPMVDRRSHSQLATHWWWRETLWEPQGGATELVRLAGWPAEGSDTLPPVRCSRTSITLSMEEI